MLFVVVTGLPGSGKTTVARPLAVALGIHYLSKDAIKEALFDTIGYGGWKFSKALSRAADAALVQLAMELEGAVLDNYWYAATAAHLLCDLPGQKVELFCKCDPEIARARFISRSRHPGHADRQGPNSPGAAPIAPKLPIENLGPVVKIDTTWSEPDIATVAREIQTVAFGSNERSQ